MPAAASATASEPLLQMAGTHLSGHATRHSVAAQRAAFHLLHPARRETRKIELVVNRYDPRKTEFDDEHVTKALGLPPKWKMPNDYAAAQRSSNAGQPLDHGKIAGWPKAFRTMARRAGGKPVVGGKKKGWSLFRL